MVFTSPDAPPRRVFAPASQIPLALSARGPVPHLRCQTPRRRSPRSPGSSAVPAETPSRPKFPAATRARSSHRLLGRTLGISFRPDRSHIAPWLVPPLAANRPRMNRERRYSRQLVEKEPATSSSLRTWSRDLPCHELVPERGW